MVAFTNNDLFTLREKILNLMGLATSWIGTLEYVRSLDKISYAQWHHEHRIPQSVLDKFWNVIALSLGFIPADEMSARPMVTIFHYFASITDASQFGTLDGSPGERIMRPIADYITQRGGIIRSGQAAREILLERGGVAGIRLENGDEVRGDAYVLAAPVHNVRRMLPESLRTLEYFNNLWSLRSVPTINVQLWFDRYVNDVDTLYFTADACFSVFGDLALTSPLHYDRHGGSMVEMCVAPAAPYWHLSDAEIVEKCRSDLQRLWPGVRPAKLLKGTAVRIPNSLYREAPGADCYRPDQRSPISNLFLAGDWTAQDYMASMEGAVQSARRASAYVVDYLHRA